MEVQKIILESFKRPILYSEEATGLRILIGVRRQDPLVYTFAVVGLFGWTVFGIRGIEVLLDRTPSALPLWPLGWAFGEIVMVMVSLFLIGGSEIVSITPDFVKCKRQFFGLGLTREYFLHEVINLRRQFPKGRHAGWLAFDYEGRTLKLVSDVNGDEAIELLGRIRQKMQDYGAETAQDE